MRNLGEDLRKIIAQNINCRLTKITSLENKIELCIKRADSAQQIFPRYWKRLKPLRTIYLNM